MYRVLISKGIPQCICRDLPNGAVMSIPINELNADFQEFLKWNAQQEIPLDYKTQQPEPITKTKEELAKEEVSKLKEKLIAGQKLTDQERANVIDSLIKLLG